MKVKELMERVGMTQTGRAIAYIKDGQLDASIRLIEDWILLYPNDSEAKEWINLIKNQM